MVIYLMRHGETAGNVANRYSGGGSDESLTAEGERKARESGVHPDITKVYVTVLRRTRQTARICFPNAAQTVADGLQEMYFGDFEGRTADELAENLAYRAWVDGGCIGVCPNGESIETFGERVYGAFTAFAQGLIDRGEDGAILVAHGGTITALLRLFADSHRSFHEWFMKNCGGYRVALDETAWPTEKRFVSYESFDRLPLE